MSSLRFALRPESFCVHRLPPDAAFDFTRLRGASWYSITRTPDELSVICPSDRVPDGAAADTAWRCLRVVDPANNLALSGLLSSLLGPLAEARVTIVTFSTYSTDYLLVPAVRLSEAVDTLHAAGHRIAL